MMKSRRQTETRFAAHPRCGFTLVELLVVLFILVILSTVAIGSLKGVQDQTQYQATQRSMENLDDAIVGPPNQRGPSGSVSITGFVADVGRLPRAIDVVGGQLQPQELWQNPNGLSAFAVLQAVVPNVAATNADADIFVSCGWRGPYLRLPVGQTNLTDGWGNPYDLLKADRSFANVGDEVSIFRSLGSEGALNAAVANNYTDDLYLNIYTAAVAAPSFPATSALNRYQATPIQGVVTDSTGAPLDPTQGKIVVRYYGPDPVTGGIKVISQTLALTAAVPSVAYKLDDPAITIGPRTLRAYQINGTTINKQSDVVRITLVAGATPLSFSLK